MSGLRESEGAGRADAQPKTHGAGESACGPSQPRVNERVDDRLHRAHERKLSAAARRRASARRPSQGCCLFLKINRQQQRYVRCRQSSITCIASGNLWQPLATHVTRGSGPEGVALIRFFAVLSAGVRLRGESREM